MTPGAIASRLVGVWKLVRYTEEREGREDNFPFGPEPEGVLIYTPDGFVWAQLMKPGRSRFESHDWHGGTADEYRQAGSGYIAYCGIYEVDEENATVAHIPSVALVPNLILKEQLRSASMSGDRLILCAISTSAENGTSSSSRLEWQRTTSMGEDATTAR
jgi:hypothetical protein